MKIKRFFATDMKTALAEVKEAFGHDAVIMSNKKVTGGVEIVAAKGYDIPDPENIPMSQASELSNQTQSSFSMAQSNDSILDTPQEDVLEAAHLKNLQQTPDSPIYEKKPVVSDSTVDSLKALLERQSRRLHQQDALREQSDTAEKIPPQKTMPNQLPAWAKSMANKNQSPKTKPLPAKKNSSVDDSISKDLSQMKADMKSLRDLLTHQVSSLMSDEQERDDPVRCMLEKTLKEHQLSDDVAKRLADCVADVEPNDVLTQLPKIFANMISVQRDDIIRQGGVVALVGPTGVGKTTTLAKLAARYATHHGAEKLGLITTDHYRIGAYEQLATYGKIMGCAVKKAKNIRELEQALYQLRTRHLVLIDTAGMSQRNMKLSQQLDNLMANPDLPIRSYLVMSAIGQRGVLSDIVQQFKRIPLSGCILTKLDESVMIGGALSVAIEEDIPLSYVTHGQRVPEDLLTADPLKLAKQALEGMVHDIKPTDKKAHWAEKLVGEFD